MFYNICCHAVQALLAIDRWSNGLQDLYGSNVGNTADYFRWNQRTSHSHDAVVDLGYSHYKGSTLDHGIIQYLGIRYASPPVGYLRWRAPVDPQVTTEILDAITFGNTCIRVGEAFPSESEDCLFVNVWAPAEATPDSKLPVWVYIQGGGYESNSNANYNASKVVEESGRSIVVVNFNYRVGAFGFLASEAILKDGTLNVGLLDQRKLLEWVQKYISLFGGNSEHVVIHGTSAGAGSLALHLTAYGGRNDNLFVGAIGQSPFFPRQPRCSDMEWQFSHFVEEAGCGGARDVMQCLRSLSTETLQAANHRSPYPGRNSPPHFYFLPCMDGDLIRSQPYQLFEEGKFIHVPIMLGDDTDEGSYFAANVDTKKELAEWIRDSYPQLTQSDSDEIMAHYPLMPALPHHAAYFPSLSAAYGDCTFVCPTLALSHAYASHYDAYHVYLYRVNIQDLGYLSAGLGVPHTMETPCIFGVGCAGGRGSSFETYNAPMIPIIMNYWISFVRDLNPNGWRWEGAPVWYPVADEGRRMRFETGKTEMEDIGLEQLEKCAFWRSLAVRMEV